jgi:hypothetical protein
MIIGRRIWQRSIITTAGALGLLLAGWACNTSSGGACTGVPDGGEAGGSGGGGGGSACMDSEHVKPYYDAQYTAPPKKTCDPCGDIYKECPLPKTQSYDDGEYTTIFYFANPTCQAGVCHYCVSQTSSEDPGVTGVP